MPNKEWHIYPDVQPLAYEDWVAEVERLLQQEGYPWELYTERDGILFELWVEGFTPWFGAEEALITT
jgi:hypothetical protein